MEADASVFRLHEKKDNVLIEGRDKPRVDLRDGKWYAMMNDKLLKFSMNNNADQFYYSPHFPELYIKQCHMAINWIEKYCMNFSHQQVHEFMSFQMTPDLYKKYNMEGLERDPIPHNATGAGGLCKFIMLNGIKGVDSRALESIMDPYAIKLWQGGINEIRREFPTAWNQDVNELHTVVNEGRYLRDFKPHVR